MSKKISVILPAFNALAYLPQAVSSILAQSHKNLELLVIDDGSTDGTGAYLRSLRDPRLVPVTNERNIGITESLNKAVEIASGEYIARMDADDIAMPHRLERQVAFLEAHGYDLVSARAHTLNKFPRRTFGIALNDQEVTLCLLFFNPVVHPLVLGKREVFRQFRYVKDFEWAEDYYLWTRMALGGVRIGVDAERLLQYRLHSGQVSVSKQQKQIALTGAVRKNYFRLKLEKAGIDPEQPSKMKPLEKFRFALSTLVSSSHVSPEIRGHILRSIVAAEVDSYGEYRAMGSIYSSLDARFGLRDGVVGLASVLDNCLNSTVPSRIAKRIIS
jgi:glycosyltransferase involved in cell wall biosynthesis